MTRSKAIARRRSGFNQFSKSSPGGSLFPPSSGLPMKPPIFDYVMLPSAFDGTKNKTDAVFEKEIIDRAKHLTPSAPTKAKVNELTDKIMIALNIEKEEKTLPDVRMNNIVKVGSFMTDTALNSSNKSDIVLQLSTLPSFETVSAISKRVIENMQKSNFREVQSVSHDYGCCFMTPTAQVRLLVTIVPEIVNKLEPDLHLNEKKMMINFFAIGHYEWFLSIIESTDSDFLQEFRSLVRCIKDARNRFFDLAHVSVWTIQYLAYYCLINGPDNQKVNLGTAFRRFFELLAAGILLPKTRSMIDPTNKNVHIGWDLTNQQRDSATMGAQTLVRIFATGNDGYRAVLGTHPSSRKEDLTQTRSAWNNIIVHPLVDAFKEGCMDPYIKEEEKQEITP